MIRQIPMMMCDGDGDGQQLTLAYHTLILTHPPGNLPKVCPGSVGSVRQWSPRVHPTGEARTGHGVRVVDRGEDENGVRHDGGEDEGVSEDGGKGVSEDGGSSLDLW